MSSTAFTKWSQKLYRWRYEQFIADVTHQEVVAYVQSEGRMTSRYSFMLCMSCGIAILGLLLSSPAVVIGAMLISPLMGPIMNLGFSLCIFDIRHLGKALEAVVLGFIMTLVISATIVHFSPLSDATPEILARTRPNLFDLLVAILSGLAGCYAAIHRKGETMVGVAIATALMPPLAVIGFGVAQWNMAIAGGAFMLFMTNLLAISLSATIFAKWYGFGREHGGKHTIWQTTLIIAVFTVLSLPLGHALSDIAYQTYATRTAKEIITKNSHNLARLNVFTIDFSNQNNIHIDAVMLTPEYNPKAQPDIQTALNDKLKRTVSLRYDQIVLDHEIITEIKPATGGENALTVAAPDTKKNAQSDIASRIKQAAFFDTNYIEINEDTRNIVIHPKYKRSLPLATLREFESAMQKRYPDWVVRTIPAAQALPPLYFQTGKALLLNRSIETLNDIVWALNRWDINEVITIGYASSAGEKRRYDNSALATKRAKEVATHLQALKIDANYKDAYRSASQLAEEQEAGGSYFQRVEVRLLPPNEPLSSITAP